MCRCACARRECARRKNWLKLVVSAAGMSEAGVGVRCRAESRAGVRGLRAARVVVRVAQPGVCRGGERTARLPRSGKALETVTRKLRRAARSGEPTARGHGTGPRLARAAPKTVGATEPRESCVAASRNLTAPAYPLWPPGRGAHNSVRPFKSRRPSREAASNISPTAAVERFPAATKTCVPNCPARA